MIYFSFVLVFLILALFIITFLRKNWRISEINAREQYSLTNSKFIVWRNVEIHYTDEGFGTPIIFLHGFGGSVHSFSKIALQLKKEYRVIRIDLPGFGLSQFPQDKLSKKNYLNMYEDLVAFFVSFLQLDNLSIAGNSLGGAIAWNSLTSKKIDLSALILIDSMGYDDAHVNKRLKYYSFRIINLLLRRGIPFNIFIREATDFYADSLKLDLPYEVIAHGLINKKGNIEAMLMLIQSENSLKEEEIDKIDCPTLILWGRQDKIVQVEHAFRFSKTIPKNCLKIYDLCGHAPMIECPEMVVNDITQFLKNYL